VPEGLNTGALSGAKASSSRTRDTSPLFVDFGLDIGGEVDVAAFATYMLWHIKVGDLAVK
jgi:hypothetical protein